MRSTRSRATATGEPTFPGWKARADHPTFRGMRAFAELLDRLALTPSRNAKLTLVRDYLAETADPDRGWALAALTGELSFEAAKPAFIRKAIEARMDPQLFWWS